MICIYDYKILALCHNYLTKFNSNPIKKISNFQLETISPHWLWFIAKVVNEGEQIILGRALQLLVSYTDYGRPTKPFFIEIPNLKGLGRQIEQIIWGAFGVFSGGFISTHFGTESSLSMFSINQPLLLQKN